MAHEPPETPALDNERATVSGRVVDAGGAALGGATVMIRATGERATTAGTGEFTLDVPANTTLTLDATAPGMAATLLPQFMVSPEGNAVFTIPLVARERITTLATLGGNPMGGAVAITVKSMSGAADHADGATVELIPSNLGKVLYASETTGMPDPDPALTAIESADSFAWALGVRPHVSIMTLALHGVSQVEPPYAIDDVTYPGTFTVDPGVLTLVTLFTP